MFFEECFDARGDGGQRGFCAGLEEADAGGVGVEEERGLTLFVHEA